MLHPRMLGRVTRPAGAKFLKLAAYCRSPLPTAPPSWDGTDGAIFRLYKNDELGDCTIAALANLASVQAAGEGSSIAFLDEEVVAFYNAVTGGHDVGAVEIDVLARVQREGFPLDGSYKIEAFAALDHGCVEVVKSAAVLFRGLYVGAELPTSAQDDGVWDVIDGPDGEPGSWGGHAMTLVGYDEAGVLLATWGKVQRATWAWWSRYVDEAYVLLDRARQDVDGLNWPLLVADIAALHGGA